MNALVAPVKRPGQFYASGRIELFDAFVINMFGFKLVWSKYFKVLFVFALLTMTTATFIYSIATMKPSISIFRIIIITLGTTMIFSVSICLAYGFICNRPRQPKSHYKVSCQIKSIPKMISNFEHLIETDIEECPSSRPVSNVPTISK